MSSSALSLRDRIEFDVLDVNREEEKEEKEEEEVEEEDEEEEEEEAEEEAEEESVVERAVLVTLDLRSSIRSIDAMT